MGEREKKETFRKSESILAQEFVDPVLAKAKKYLETYGGIEPAPLFLRMESGEREIVPISFPETNEEKRLYFTALGLSIHLAGQRIREDLLVSEGWYVELEEKPETLDIAPSQHPSRKEAVVVTGRDAQIDYLFNSGWAAPLPAEWMSLCDGNLAQRAGLSG